MDINEVISNLKKNVNLIGLESIELENDDFICEKKVTYNIFKEITNLSKLFEFNEVMYLINTQSNTYDKQKNTLFIHNLNEIFNYCNKKNYEYTEIKIHLNKLQSNLDDINSKRDIVFLSTEHFNAIKNSFYEGNPLIEDLFISLSNINLGDICRIKNEISIESKLF